MDRRKLSFPCWLINFPGESSRKEFSPNEPVTFWNLFSNQSEKRFGSRSMQIGFQSIQSTRSIRLNLIRMNQNLNWIFNLFNPNESEVGMIRIDALDWIGLNRIKADIFLTDLHRIRSKMFLGVIQNDSE